MKQLLITYRKKLYWVSFVLICLGIVTGDILYSVFGLVTTILASIGVELDLRQPRIDKSEDEK